MKVYMKSSYKRVDMYITFLKIFIDRGRIIFNWLFPACRKIKDYFEEKNKDAIIYKGDDIKKN